MSGGAVVTQRTSWHAGPVRGRRSRRWVVLVGALGLLAAACSSASGSSTPASSATSTTLPGVRPVASGSVTAVSGSSITVESQFSGTTSVLWTSSTTFSQTVSGTAQDLTVGSCVAVTGTPPASGSAAGPVVARTGHDHRVRLPVPVHRGHGLRRQGIQRRGRRWLWRRGRGRRWRWLWRRGRRFRRRWRQFLPGVSIGQGQRALRFRRHLGRHRTHRRFERNVERRNLVQAGTGAGLDLGDDDLHEGRSNVARLGGGRPMRHRARFEGLERHGDRHIRLGPAGRSQRMRRLRRERGGRRLRRKQQRLSPWTVGPVS